MVAPRLPHSYVAIVRCTETRLQEGKCLVSYSQTAMNDGEAHIEAGNRALEAGDWAAARDAFRAALADSEPPEALYGLGDALWWLGDMRGALVHFERAYAAFRRRPDPASAAAVALRLGFDYRTHLGNEAAANGWLARAERLIEEHALEALRGELLLMKANGAEDAAAGERWARQAFERARQSGDLDLELCTLSQLGVSLVEQGRIEEGMPLLDEAMAGSLGGEPEDLGTVVFTSCNMMVSCAKCAAFERAMEWVRAAERFARRYGCPFLYVECRTVYGAVLVAQGDWAKAEEELETAIELARDSVPAYYAEALATLAELRLAQGRIEEAKRLLTDIEGRSGTVPVTARLHLVCGKPALAATEVRRRLDVIGPNQLESIRLLELLGEAEIAQGKGEAAAERGRTLADRGAALGCDVAIARGERLRGHALSQADVEAARPHLDAGLSTFMQLEMPYEAARTRLMIAEALRDHTPEAAVVEAQAALNTFEQFGANRDADRAAALLRTLGVRATRTGARSQEPVTKREREVLDLLGEGLSNPEIAERLFISRKTVEHHVSSILTKLGLRNRTEAAAEAVRRRFHASAKK